MGQLENDKPKEPLTTLTAFQRYLDEEMKAATRPKRLPGFRDFWQGIKQIINDGP
jgi:hypothetical protein